MHSRLIIATLAVTLGLGACAARHGGPGPGHGPGPGYGAGPGYGPGGGPGPGHMGGRWGADYTPGWGVMTPQERDAHRSRMESARTYEECRKEMEAHHQRMVERARERGQTMPSQPMRDPCSSFKR
jgi:hypothetical protein